MFSCRYLRLYGLCRMACQLSTWRPYQFPFKTSKALIKDTASGLAILSPQVSLFTLFPFLLLANKDLLLTGSWGMKLSKDTDGIAEQKIPFCAVFCFFKTCKKRLFRMYFTQQKTRKAEKANDKLSLVKKWSTTCRFR